MVKFRGTHFTLQKSKPKKQAVGVQETFMELCGTLDVCNTLTFQKIFPVI